jgi:uncharacterized protein YneF (UPF0154 family)
MIYVIGLLIAFAGGFFVCWKYKEAILANVKEIV